MNEKLNHVSLIRVKKIITPFGTEKDSTMCYRKSFRPQWELKRGSMLCLSPVKLVKK